MKLIATGTLSLLTLTLFGCGEEVKIVEPTAAERKITVLLFDKRVEENALRKFNADQMTLNEVFDKLGEMDSQQSARIRCDGGYGKQPPLYSFDVGIKNGAGQKSDIVNELPSTATAHDLCMRKAKAHIQYLKQYAPDELKYYR